jgi:uncharacterized membrane protein
MLEFVHYLHVLSAIAFGGTVIYQDWVLGPYLVVAQTEDRQRVANGIGKNAAIVMVGALLLVLITGGLRLWLGGMIQSWGDWLEGYGLRALLAIVAIFVIEGVSSPIRTKYTKSLVGDDDMVFATAFRQQRVINVFLLLVMLALMIAMQMGI